MGEVWPNTHVTELCLHFAAHCRLRTVEAAMSTDPRSQGCERTVKRLSGPSPIQIVAGGAHLPVVAVEPVGGWTTKCVMHGQCDAGSMVTLPAAERHCPLAGTKLYCLVTEAHGCEQLAQSFYLAADRPGVELATSRSRVKRPNHSAILSHPE